MSETPDGWVLIPKEPTQEMIDAAWRVTVSAKPEDRIAVAIMSSTEMQHAVKMRQRYAAMISAAPTPPSIPTEKDTR